MIRRFIAGRSRAELLPEILKEIGGRNGLALTLNYLGEEVRDRAAALAAREEYSALLRDVSSAFPSLSMLAISVKPTQLGLDISESFCRENLLALAAEADRAGVSLHLDMESSFHTEATIRLYEALRAKFRNVGVALQAYLRRTFSDMERLLSVGGGIRWVKGAYREPASVAFVKKREVDNQYALGLRRLAEAAAEGRIFLTVGTHDEEMLRRAIGWARIFGLDSSREKAAAAMEIGMLRGVRSARARELASFGWRVNLYTPYGTHAVPYLLRRLRERPANLLFGLRHLFA